MRIIDADALIESIKNTADLGGWIGETLYQIKQVAVKYIDSAPSIDIVFCKECKHYAEHNELYINAPTNCVKHSTINHYVAVNADDFCSYGEREGE